MEVINVYGVTEAAVYQTYATLSHLPPDPGAMSVAYSERATAVHLSVACNEGATLFSRRL